MLIGFSVATHSATFAMILLLVAASNFFGAVFSRMGSPALIAESLLTLNYSPTLMLLLILAIIFALASLTSQLSARPLSPLGDRCTAPAD